MIDKLNQKLAATFSGHLDASNDPDAADDLGSFGLLRGLRERSQMLTLKKTGGNQVAIAYAWIERIEFNPSENCITLHGVGRDVRIRGNHLINIAKADVTLFDGLTRHRVPWIRESGRADTLKADLDTCVVTGIEW